MTGGLLLATALGTILLGPVMLRLARSSQWMPFLDGFALVGVGGIAALHLLPEAFESGGLLAGAFFLIGLFLPPLAERYANRSAEHSSALLVLGGILPHMLIESAALAASPEHKLLGLGTAIIAHRLPVSLFVFSMITVAYSTRRAWQVMCLLALVTLLGYWFGDHLLADLAHAHLGWLQALVGGTLLHVIFAHDLEKNLASKTLETPEDEVVSHSSPHTHSHDEDGCAHGHEHSHEHGAHDHQCDHHHAQPAWMPTHSHSHGADKHHNRWATLGVLFGALLVAGFVLEGHEHEHATNNPGFSETLAKLCLETAPILLLAYLLAGLIRSFITPAQLGWLGRGSPSLQAVKGVTFGLPLPICSCGVLPIYETLIKRGVPASAAIGFLVATPELGLDAILISIPLLGAELTGVRLIAAFIVAFAVAVFVGRGLRSTKPVEQQSESTSQASIQTRLKNGVHFGLVELFDHTFPWVLAGLLVAAWAEPILDESVFATIPSYLQVPLFALIGIPVYVCASGSTPLAAIAIHKGISPGAAIAFLIAGPATNVTTFGILGKLHGKRTATIFGGAVAVCAILAGLLVDYLAIDAVLDLHVDEHHSSQLLGWLSLFGILALFVGSLLRQGPRGAMSQITDPIDV